jgi:hypothetical protein
MNVRLAASLVIGALFAVFAPPMSAANEVDVEEAPISLTGCVQRETDYRRQHNSGKGGFLGFGGGLGNEYVLVNASRGADGGRRGCGSATGEAYELTGSAEGDLEAFVGQRVAITGMRKAAEIDSATGQPTGGRQAGDDLRLFEVDVESFRALVAPAQTGTVTRLEQQEPRFESEQQGIDDSGAVTSAPPDQDADARVEQLPRTASPLALTGLAALLSLAGGVGLRGLRRRGEL